MDKQKVRDYLEQVETDYLLSASDFDQGILYQARRMKEALDRGEFDPITSPTIKPGEEAIHKDIGNVKILWLGVNRATVSKDGLYYDVYLKDLEVIESD